VSPHISVVRLTLPSWDIVNKQGQRWIPGITAARTIHLHLLCLLVLQKSAQHESSKTSLAFTEQKCCRHLLQLAPLYSNSISPAMLDLLQRACCIQIPCIGGKAPLSIQSRDKLHTCCLNKCSFAQKDICEYVHCQGELLRFNCQLCMRLSFQILVENHQLTCQLYIDYRGWMVLKKVFERWPPQDHNNVANMHIRAHFWEAVESEVWGEAIPWGAFRISKPIMGCDVRVLAQCPENPNAKQPWVKS
jgi:hypothetical protein